MSTLRAAYIWSAAGNIAKSVITLGISLLLARKLQPADYGLVAMTMVVTSILSAVQDFGLGQAVVYFEDRDEHRATYFTVTFGVSLLLTIGLVAVTPWIADFYHTPAVMPVFRVLSLMLLFDGLRSVGQGMLSKQLRFREITIAETVAGLSGGFLALWMVYHDYGAWSLVGNLMTGSVLQALLICYWVRPRFTWRPDWHVLRRALRWGLPNTGSTLLYQWYESADALIVGKLLGTVDLGIYTQALRLSKFLGERLTAIVNRVTFSSFAALQNDRERLVAQWLRMTTLLALINFPALTILAWNGGDFLVSALGSKWLPAANPLAFLCFIAAMRSVQTLLPLVNAALGATQINFQFSLLNALLLPPAFFAGCKLGGLQGVVWSWVLIFPWLCIFLLWRTLRLSGISVGRYTAALRLPLLVALCCWLGMMPWRWVADTGWLRLFASTATGMLAGGCIVWCSRQGRELLMPLLQWNR